MEKFEKERDKTTRVLDLLQERCDVKQGTCGDDRIKSWGANGNPAGVVGYFIDSFKIQVKKLKKEDKHNKQVIKILDRKCRSYKKELIILRDYIDPIDLRILLQDEL